MHRESLEQVQQLKQQQKLSPAQVRYVKMLEMTGPEIEEEVRHEVEDNPALERVDDPAVDTGEGGQESAEQMQRADYRDDDIPSYRLEARNHSVNDRYHEPMAVAGINLSEYLMEQLRHSGATDSIVRLAPYIIGNLDRNGYLRRSLHSIADDIAMDLAIDVEPSLLDDTFEAIRRLDPAGICAVDLRDCLSLQLRRLDRNDPAVALATSIVETHFDTFSRMHFDRLAQSLGVSLDTLRRAVDVIRSLNPKPAAAFDSADDDVAHTIIPDFSVDVEGDDINLSLLNNIPELRVDATFTDQSEIPGESTTGRRQANAFIAERRDRANEFINMLRQRQQTLFRVMAAIVKIQRDFFLTDDESRLRPMVLKDIAALTGYDLSVISRATSSKYVVTRSGIYPLKFFFNESIPGSVGDEEETASSRALIAALRQIIDNEDPRHPLSDLAITKQLGDKGITVARRTVSKYRERLGIPVARLRRKL